jgi:hypothetical protein
MSYLVTRLVRAAILPSTLPRLPAAKGVLLALADDCDDDGRGRYAGPALATIGREAALCRRSVINHLARLQAIGVIVEQVRPTQHRPRTWRIDLPTLARWVDPLAPLSDPDRQLVARLTAADSPLDGPSDMHPVAPLTRSRGAIWDARGASLSPQGCNSLHPNGIKNGVQNGNRTPAPTPAFAFADKAKEPNGDNVRNIKKLAIDLLAETGRLPFGEFVERVKQRCADLRIDYGRDEAVPDDVVHRACLLAELLAIKATCATTELRQRQRRQA